MAKLYSADKREQIIMLIRKSKGITFKTQNIIRSRSSFYNLMSNLKNAKADKIIYSKSLKKERGKKGNMEKMYHLTIYGKIYEKIINSIRSIENAKDQDTI